MALSECSVSTDPRGKELKEHGSSLFPIACYNDDLGVNPVPWHWHDELEAVVMECGDAVLGADGQEYPVHQGDGFFIRSGVLHSVRNAGDSPCRLHSIVFHPRLVGGSAESIFWQKYISPLLSGSSADYVCFRLGTDWEALAIAAIEEAWHACASECDGYEFQVREALSRLMFLLSGHRFSKQKPPSEKTLRSGARIKTMLQYIQEHYDGKLTIGDIAKSASISESECLRCFQSMIGTSPIHYLREYRVQKAAELLRGGEQKIADVAARCGFQEMSYFSRVFREMKGCLPSEYRIRK